MLKIEHTSVAGFDAAIRGVRNSFNSWHLSDSVPGDGGCEVIIGKKDLSLMQGLRAAGSDHRKYMRMICVWCDITAPLYWWKQADCYRIGVATNSTSTMHTIHKRDLTLDDFSHEHLKGNAVRALDNLITVINDFRAEYIANSKKEDWYAIIQLLPSSYNQKRTVMLNYEVLANMYKSRKGHRLDEWKTLLDWIEGLPYSELITDKQEKEG